MIVPFSFGVDIVNEGEIAQLTCAVRRGDFAISITWSLKGDVISSDPAITTTMIGQQTSLLMISSVGVQAQRDLHLQSHKPCRIRNSLC